MTGYLDRLLARVVDGRADLAPATAARFAPPVAAAPGATVEPAGRSGATGDPPAVLSPPDPDRRSPARPPPTGTAPERAPATVPDAGDGATARPAAAERPSAARPHFPRTMGGSPSPEDRGPTGPADPRQTDAGAPSGVSAAPPAAHGRDRSAAAPDRPATPAVDRAPAAGRASAAPPPRAPEGVQPPGLGERDVIAKDPRGRDAAAADARGGETAPIVTVRIGRIEVRPETPPRRPAAPAPPRGPRLTLADYVAARRRGER